MNFQKKLRTEILKNGHAVWEFKEDIIHQFHVISEDVISKVKLVAEGVAVLMKNLTAY